MVFLYYSNNLWLHSEDTYENDLSAHNPTRLEGKRYKTVYLHLYLAKLGHV